MKLLYCFGLCVSLSLMANAQDSLFVLPKKYVGDVEKKADKVANHIDVSTEKFLTALLRQEEKLYRKVKKISPTQADGIFKARLDSLQSLQKTLKLKKPKLPGSINQYVPALDSLSSSLKFLDGNKAILPTGTGKIQGAMSSVASLQQSINNAAQVERYIKEQKKMLQTQLAQFSGISKDLKAISKDAYYYGEQIKEYKSLLNDRKNAEKKAMELLSKSKVYKDFMQRNSQLASLFGLPSASATRSIEGLQTRTMVEEAIRQRVGGSSEAQQTASQLMDRAQQQFSEFKSKLPDANTMADAPDFEPNPMKGKPFLHRIELGGNFQFQKTSQYFPSSTEIAAQAAYKLNAKSSAGIGVSYALGMGTSWNHIRFSHQSIGLRSFIDWKLKRSFYINGGAEGRYISTIRNADELKAFNRWKPSILLGVSKKYKINAKLKGNIQLLYDFMAKQQMPVSNPIILRLGYTKL